METKVTEEDAFILLLKNVKFDVLLAIEKCRIIKPDKAMYLIAPEGTDITLLRDFNWRPDGIFFYKNETELLKIGYAIRKDLKFIREVGK